MKITIEKALEQNNTIFIDTRSPQEFLIDNIPGSINIPIFDNQERHDIGLLYKQSRKKAFDLGFNIYNKKMDQLKEGISKLDHKKTLIVYCWRGGMRSKAITELVEELGYKTFQLDGGYKSYRTYVRTQLEKYQPPFKFIVLYGLACNGKTELIKKLPNSIDLEGLAQHRSSNFGALGLIPNTQKKFETLLLKKLNELKNQKFVFIEGESHKVGEVFIPNSIFKGMKQGIAIKVNRSTEKRLKQAVKDYFTHNEDQKIKEIINSFKQYLSKKIVEDLLRLMDEKNYSEVSKILLLDYYDLKYAHQLDNIEYQVEVNSDDINECIKELIKFENSSN